MQAPITGHIGKIFGNKNSEKECPILKQEKYSIKNDLFKMMKFVEPEVFTNNNVEYSQQAILTHFKNLAKRLHIYKIEGALEIYQIGKSQVLSRTFNSKEDFTNQTIWNLIG
jgi:hypothetical protein